MERCWLKALLCSILLALLLNGVATLSPDPDASTALEKYIKRGDVVISTHRIRPRRKLHISIEALFMIDFPTLKNKLAFYLDRKEQRVTLDITANGAKESRNFDMPNINETSTIRSLALHFSKNRITLFIDCKPSTAHDIDVNLNKLYTQMDDPVIKLFRERKYPLYFDDSVKHALRRGGSCNSGIQRRGNRRMLKNKISEREKSKKRDIRSWHNELTREEQYRQHHHQQQQQQQQQREQEFIPTDVERGDIPVMHGDCEDALAKSLNDLLALVRLLRDDIAHQRKEIDYLRTFIENCASCKEPTGDNNILPSPQPIIANCRNANPCYPGVECLDTAAGPRCGRCPAGNIGDGKQCKPGITCAERPCFAGVQCRDNALAGAQCDPCPIGYEGDGRACTLRNACLDGPCPTGNQNVQHYHRQYTSRKYSVVTKS